MVQKGAAFILDCWFCSRLKLQHKDKHHSPGILYGKNVYDVTMRHAITISLIK